jgi:hypothetical protein
MEWEGRALALWRASTTWDPMRCAASSARCGASRSTSRCFTCPASRLRVSAPSDRAAALPRGFGPDRGTKLRAQ